jgi:DNA-binding response OmpR family regulator
MKRTILIVDDDASMIHLLRFILSSEYEVVALNNPYEALQSLTKYSIDAIISDFSMPSLNGLELIKQIRSDLQSDLPIIMLSSKDQSDDKIACLEAGADDYLVKPFNPGELKARLRSVFRRIERSATYANAV